MSSLDRKNTIESLTHAATRVKATIERYEEDINRLKHRHTYTPSEPQIQPSTSIPDALNVLASSLAYHNKRCQLLGHQSRGLIDLMLTRVKPLLSTETKDWHAKRCFAEVERDLLARHEALHEEEQAHIYNMGRLHDLITDLINFEQADEIAVFVGVVAVADCGRTLLEVVARGECVSDMEYEDARCRMEKAIEQVNWLRAAVERHDWAVNRALWAASLLVGEPPRQRLITEFFEPVE